ncbi:MAG: acylphosphatase [Sphingomonas sp.]
MIARRLIVRGRVQGVGYRWWTVETARAAGLAGWVRNRPDGTVEIHAEGKAAALDTFADACGGGPPSARVDAVDVAEATVAGGEGFAQRATG